MGFAMGSARRPFDWLCDGLSGGLDDGLEEIACGAAHVVQIPPQAINVLSFNLNPPRYLENTALCNHLAA